MTTDPGFEVFDQYEDPEAPKPKRKRTVLWVLLSFLALVLIAALVAGIFAWNLLHKFETKSKTIPNALPSYSGQPVKEKNDKSVNMLLLGSDTRATSSDPDEAASAGGRSDTMMFVHIPEDRHNVTITSIMRDTWVPIPGHGSAKINAAFSYGGVPLAVRTVEQLLDTKIDHVATIDFEGFKDLVDALDGVEVNVPKPFTKAGTHYEGKMKLNGEQALWFARERHAFADGDYQRVKDQQILMKAIFSKTLSRSTLTSPSKISNVVDDFSPYIGVDNKLTGGTVAKLGWSMRSVRGDDIKMFTMPTLGTGWSDDGQSIVKPDMDAIKEFGKALKDEDTDGFMKSHKLG
jgi:LCP family protein required for cell wall assembly